MFVDSSKFPLANQRGPVLFFPGRRSFFENLTEFGGREEKRPVFFFRKRENKTVANKKYYMFIGILSVFFFSLREKKQRLFLANKKYYMFIGILSVFFPLRKNKQKMFLANK